MDMENKEVSLLDLLIVAAENFKLLVFAPVVVGLFALGGSYALPRSFKSEAILALPTVVQAQAQTPTQAAMQAQAQTPVQAAAMMSSFMVLAPVIESLNLAAGSPVQVASAKVAKQINVKVGKDGLLRLDVSADSPIEAQELANAVIDSWLKNTVPRGETRADLEARLAYAKVGLESARRFVERLTSEGATELAKPLSRGEASATITTAVELQARYQAEVLDISRALGGLSRDVVKQQPTLPTEPAAPKNGFIAVFAALGCGLALLLWVFVRQAWRTAAQDPETAEKQAKLRTAMGFKGRPD